MRIREQLIRELNFIEGNGSFVSSGTRKPEHPGLYIEQVGEISLPVIPHQVKEVIKVASQAPFGKGSKTVTDTTIRNAWEIDAGQVSFRNKKWDKFIAKILKKTCKGLGLEQHVVVASLYKLLIYEAGGFFLPHKDSEKEKGMFATLIVGLPSQHTGGELYVRFGGEEEVIDFSGTTDKYRIPYVAFYADCEHEIKPVTSGYRICLVYNLIQADKSEKIVLSEPGKESDNITNLLKSWSGDFHTEPKAILLGHQYTPTNFSLENLKHHDLPRAKVLMQAARAAGYFATLGLVTCYQSGSLDGDDYYYSRRRGRYYDDDYDDDDSGSEGTMGEIFEEYTTIEHWADDDTPGLGQILIDEKDIISSFELAEGDPVLQEKEGYTGNAGMTMEYWYHYGAVILWPEDKHFDLLKAHAGTTVQLKWLDYYLHHWDSKKIDAPACIRRVLQNLLGLDFKEDSYHKPDFTAVANTLAKLQDQELVKQNCIHILTHTFDQIKLDGWHNLLDSFDENIFAPVFRKAVAKNVYRIHHLLEILQGRIAAKGGKASAFVHQCIQELPDYLKQAQLSTLNLSTSRYYFSKDEKRRYTITAIVKQLLDLSAFNEKDSEWLQSLTKRISKGLNREYVNDVLVPVLVFRKGKENNLLTQELYQRCHKDLIRRTKREPQPLPDWKREVPNTTSYKDIWEILTPFLNSPTAQVFDYKMAQAYRSQMASAISNVTIDLKMETVRKGSPHILRLTKTQAAYEKQHKEWQEDLVVLGQLETWAQAL